MGKLIARYWPQFAVLAVAVVLWAPRLSGPIDLRWDAGVYYVLGTSFATGHGYRILSEPGSPEALEYPPLLPAVVALYQRALGTTDAATVGLWLRRSYAVLFVVYGLVAFALARKYLQPWFALVAVTLCLLQIQTIFLSDLLFTELPFGVVSVVFVLISATGRSASRPWLREMVSFTLATAAFLLRTAGVALFAAWVIEALARRRWRLALARGALALVPIALWQAHVERVRTSDEYVHPAYEYQRAPYQTYNVAYAENILLLDPFQPERGLADRRALVTRLVTNFAKMPAALGEAVSTSYIHWRSFLQDGQHRFFGKTVIPIGFAWLPIFGLAMLVVGGLVVFLHCDNWTLASLVVLSIALMCFTPWPDQFGRYLMPITPFLTMAAALTLERSEAALRVCGSVRTIALGRAALTGLLVLTVAVQAHAALWLFGERARAEGATFVPGGSSAGARFFYHDHGWRTWEQAATWIDAHAAPGEVVATIAPHEFYLRTGLRAVYPPMDANAERARHLLEAVPVSHVIVDGFPPYFSRRYALPAVKGDPGWRFVQSFNGTQIYARSTGRP
jgi:hypothetical protein